VEFSPSSSSSSSEVAKQAFTSASTPESSAPAQLVSSPSIAVPTVPAQVSAAVISSSVKVSLEYKDSISEAIQV